MVYADLRPVRLLTHFDRHPVPHSPDYQHFIDTTGILPERDLDRVALALHRMPDPTGPNGPVGYSEVFSGRLEVDRLTAYLGSIATARERYAGHEIFVLTVADPSPHGVRLLRVAVLSDSLVAASNMPTAEQLHSILDHARTPALLRSGPLVLSGLYPRVPLAAAAWGVGQLALPLAEGGHVAALGLRLPVLADQPMVASLRYTTALHLRLELLAGTDAAAATQTEALDGMLSLTRALTTAETPSAAPLSEILNSATAVQQRDRTVVQAVIPVSLLQSLASGHP